MKLKRSFTLLVTAVMLLGLMGIFSSCASGTTYYISSSEGNDDNNGTSAKSPWKSFAHVNEMFLKPGDKVLLKRGDVWNERMEVRGEGEKNAWVKISNYGDKNDELPVISLNNDKNDICMLITDLNSSEELNYRNNLKYIHLDGIDFRNTYVAVYYRIIATKDNIGFKVTNCNFKNIRDESVFENELKDVSGFTAWSNAAKGNLATVTDWGTYKETGGGKGEYCWPESIIISGKARYDETVLSEVEVSNCVFEDATGGLSIRLKCPQYQEYQAVSKVRMFDCVMKGTYNGLYAFSTVDGGWDGTDNSEWGYIRNVRHIGGSDLYAGVTGPTGGYMAACHNFLVENSEMSYVYNNGAKDGCGFDYETYSVNILQRNMLFHNNDAAGLLMLRPGAGYKKYDNVHLNHALFYNNIKNPLNEVIDADLMTGAQDNTISYNNIFSYRPSAHPKNPNFKPHFIYYAPQAEQKNNVSGFLEDYRQRFAFNGSSYESWNTASSGVKDLKVENGKLTFTLTEDTGYIVSNLPINLFAYTDCILNLEGTTAKRVKFGYKEPESGSFFTGDAAEIKGNIAYLSIPDRGNSYGAATMLYFEGKAGDKVVIDSIEYTTEFNFDGRLIEDGRVLRMTVSGKSFPMFESDITKEGFEISGLPAGVTVEQIEQYNANTVYVYLSDAISQGTEISVSVDADNFIPYFTEMQNNLDFGHRTPEAEATLFGYFEIQTYIKNGAVTGGFTVK
ncbi:MAG: hypothetical protein IKA51_00530 [Clostridia bacterium]|nr:hypothetical protein [Clostridia bacterium]